MNDRDWVEDRIRQVHIVAAALVGGILSYMVVAVVLASRGMPGPGLELGGTTLGVVALTVALLLVLAPVLRRTLLDAGRPRDADEVVERWIRASITGLAVREAAGFLGITVGLVAAEIPWILGFGLATIAAMGLGWPRAAEPRERIRKREARSQQARQR